MLLPNNALVERSSLDCGKPTSERGARREKGVEAPMGVETATRGVRGVLLPDLAEALRTGFKGGIVLAFPPLFAASGACCRIIVLPSLGLSGGRIKARDRIEGEGELNVFSLF